MFAELHCKSHYSFLRGASSPEALLSRAEQLGYSALAITDECSFAGIVKAYKASLQLNIKLIIGSEFCFSCADIPCTLILLAPNRLAYSEISLLITKSRMRSAKGEYHITIHDLRFGLSNCLAIWLPERQCHDDGTINEQGRQLKSIFKTRLWLGIESFLQADDQDHYLQMQRIAAHLHMNMLACNDVHTHHRDQQYLQDVLSAINNNCCLDELGHHKSINAEKTLKSIKLLQHQYPQALLDESCRIAELCHFSLDELRYEYPRELVPRHLSAKHYLHNLCYAGAKQRWPQGIPDKTQQQIDYELKIIHELEYEYYFLTVEDIVRFARQRNILCQGRGSAANSAVCYCLFITEVDPSTSNLLFERFISRERQEPPDIDVDFESCRREEVIQYIYQKYGRKRTAIAATVITYRRKSAINDVGKALNIPETVRLELRRYFKQHDSIDGIIDHFQTQKNISIDPEKLSLYLQLIDQLIGTPRHLSQHVGGFLITQSPTSTLVPIENAAMANRSIIQWDKDDIETLGLLKIDVLSLGMLSAIHRSLDLINLHQLHPSHLSLETIPREDTDTYNMLCAGDSVGVFQVESRAQMSMLPRLKPRQFYDLVIQVAIVRPGPIQGNMVHPYLKRRNGEEATNYPSPAIKKVLERTLGVPIFQEQVIQLTMEAAGFSGGEADQLRRAMASWGKNGDLEQFRHRLTMGMLNRGYEQEFAERLFRQMQGFASYGFPESHAASFALLVYFSAWLKCHYPEAFYCALLNSQPMGFYSPSQLIQDAKRHQIEILPICFYHSEADCSLTTSDQRLGIRLGLKLIKGLQQSSIDHIIKQRQLLKPNSIKDIKANYQIQPAQLQLLIDAGALQQINQNRYANHWQSCEHHQVFAFAEDKAEYQTEDQIEQQAIPEYIQTPSQFSDMLSDYRSSGLSLQHHPMQFVRSDQYRNCILIKDLSACRNKSWGQIIGMVTGKQKPASAAGVLFMTLEDETGNANVIIWQSVQQRYRRELAQGTILHIKGIVEISHSVTHLVAAQIFDRSDELNEVTIKSRDFR